MDQLSGDNFDFLFYVTNQLFHVICVINPFRGGFQIIQLTSGLRSKSITRLFQHIHLITLRKSQQLEELSCICLCAKNKQVP